MKVDRIHKYAKFQAIPPISSQEKIPGNPKYDLFQYVQMPPKWGNSQDRYQNLIISKWDQDTSACKISRHSSRTFSRKFPEPEKILICFTKFFGLCDLEIWQVTSKK